jgi:hypothetical protein
MIVLFQVFRKNLCFFFPLQSFVVGVNYACLVNYLIKYTILPPGRGCNLDGVLGLGFCCRVDTEGVVWLNICMGGACLIMFGCSFFLFWFASHSLFFLERISREPSLVYVRLGFVDIVLILIHQLVNQNSI